MLLAMITWENGINQLEDNNTYTPREGIYVSIHMMVALNLVFYAEERERKNDIVIVVSAHYFPRCYSTYNETSRALVKWKICELSSMFFFMNGGLLQCKKYNHC